MDPEGDGRPDPRRYHTAAYNPDRGTVMVYGGYFDFFELCDGEGGGNCATLWEWDGVSWARAPTADATGDGKPLGTLDALNMEMVYDPARRQLRLARPPAELAAENTLGFESWVWDPGEEQRPGHVLRVPRVGLGLGVDFEVLGMDVQWRAAATSQEGLEQVSGGVDLAMWRRDGWRVVEHHAGSPGALELVTWSAPAEALGHVWDAPGRWLGLAVTPAGGNGSGRSVASIEAGYVQVTLRYRTE